VSDLDDYGYESEAVRDMRIERDELLAEVERLRIYSEQHARWLNEAVTKQVAAEDALRTLYDATSTLSALVPDTLAERLLKARDVALAALSEEPTQP
jgi:hypothetical protein